MSAFHPFQLMDSFSQYLYREADFTDPALHCPPAYALGSEDHYLPFDSCIFHPTSIRFDLPNPHCHYHTLPLPRPPSYFIHGLVDWLAIHELGLDRAPSHCIHAPERKWKWKAEFKGPKGNGFDHKYKCTVKLKGDVEKKVTWTVDLQGKGKHAPLSRVYKFHAASSLSPQDVCQKVNKEQKVKGAADQKLISIRQDFGNRSVQKSKGKKKEHSPQDAAIAIQRTFRDYMSRRSRVVHCLRDLAVAKSKLKEIRVLISKFSYRNRLAKDAEERQRFSEKIIILLLTVDAIEAPDYLVRSAKRSMTRELEAVLEAVDPQLMGQRKFDLPAGFSSMAMASGVADVVRMLDQEDDNGSGIPPLF